MSKICVAYPCSIAFVLSRVHHVSNLLLGAKTDIGQHVCSVMMACRCCDDGNKVYRMPTLLCALANVG